MKQANRYGDNTTPCRTPHDKLKNAENLLHHLTHVTCVIANHHSKIDSILFGRWRSINLMNRPRFILSNAFDKSNEHTLTVLPIISKFIKSHVCLQKAAEALKLLILYYYLFILYFYFSLLWWWVSRQLWQAVNSFDKHELIWIIWANSISIYDMHIQLSSFLHFYLLYLLLNSCDGNDAKSLLNAFCAVGRRWRSPVQTPVTHGL